MVFPIIGAAVSAIGATLASIGPAAASFATTVLPRLLPYIGKGLEVIQAIGQVAQLVAQVLGIFKPGEKIDEMGARAMQAAEQGITPDRFDTHDDYMNELRNFELDPSKKADPIAKIIAGLAVASHGLDEKLGAPEGTAGQLWPLVAADGGYFTAERLIQYVQTGQNLADIVDYFTGKLGGAESLEVEDKLVKLDQKTHPEIDENSLREALYKHQEQVQSQP